MTLTRPMVKFLASLAFWLMFGPLFVSAIAPSEEDKGNVLDSVIAAQDEFCKKIEGKLSEEVYRLYAVPQHYSAKEEPRILKVGQSAVPSIPLDPQAIFEATIAEAVLACKTRAPYQKLMNRYIEVTYPRRFVSAD